MKPSIKAVPPPRVEEDVPVGAWLLVLANVNLMRKVADLEARNQKLTDALHRETGPDRPITDGRRQVFGQPSWAPAREAWKGKGRP